MAIQGRLNTHEDKELRQQTKKHIRGRIRVHTQDVVQDNATNKTARHNNV